MAKVAYREKKVLTKAEPKAEPKVDDKVQVVIQDEQDEKKFAQRVANQELKIRCQRLFQSAADSRKRYDWEWLTRDLYRRGYQFSRYNPSSRTVILSTRAMVKIPINLVWAQMRIIKNQVTSFRPKWETLPRGKDDQALSNARYSNKLLDYYYDKFNLRDMIKDTVTMGLQYSVGGPWEIGYDPDGDNGKGEIYIWLRDPYDFYIDPYATSVDDAEYCCTAVRQPLEAIKANPDFKFYDELVKGERRVASSEYKQFLIQSLKQATEGDIKEEEGAILKQMYLKVRITKDNSEAIAKELRENEEEDKKLRLGEIIMRKVTFVDFIVDPLRVQLLRRSDFPFEVYHADHNPVEFYGESWLKHVIPMNRVVNALESSTFDFNYRYAKGRIVIDKNSGVRIVDNQHGSIIEKNRGAEVSTLPLNPLPNTYQVQIDNMRRYIEDIGGAHDVSLGRLPTGVKSGIGIAELKSADATNQQDLVDALESFLVKVAGKILRTIALNYDVPRVIRALGKGGDPQHFAVIGERGGKGRSNNKQVKIGVDTFNLAVIGAENEIRVTIGSWLAYTKSAQHDKLKELFQAGLIDQKTFLENAEFSDVEAIVDRTRKEEMLKKFRGQPGQPGMPSDEEIAEQENFQMTKEGKTPEALETDNHDVHLVVHQEALGIDGNPIVEAHMTQHEKFKRGEVSTEATRMTGVAEAPVTQGEEMPPQMRPMGQPAGLMAGSPEEQALMESMAMAQGGQ